MTKPSEPNGVTRRGFIGGAIASATALVTAPHVAGRIDDGRIEFTQAARTSLPRQNTGDVFGEEDVPVVDLRRAYVTGQKVDLSLRPDDGGVIQHCNVRIAGDVTGQENENYHLVVQLQSVDRDEHDYSIEINFVGDNYISYITLIDNSVEIDHTNEATRQESWDRKYKRIYGESDNYVFAGSLPKDFTVDIKQKGKVAEVVIGWKEPKDLRGTIESMEDFYDTYLVPIEVPIPVVRDITVSSESARDGSLDVFGLHTMDRVGYADLEVFVNEFSSTPVPGSNVPALPSVALQVIRPGYVNVQRFETDSDPITKLATEYEDVLVIEPAATQVHLYSGNTFEYYRDTGRPFLPADPSLTLGELQPNSYREPFEVPCAARIVMGNYRGLDALAGSIAVVKNPVDTNTAQFVWVQPNIRAIAEYDCGTTRDIVARNTERASSYYDLTDEYDTESRYLTPNELTILLGQTSGIILEFTQEFGFDSEGDIRVRKLQVAGSQILRGHIDIPIEFDLDKPISVFISDYSKEQSANIERIPVREMEYPTAEIGMPAPVICDPVARIV